MIKASGKCNERLSLLGRDVEEIGEELSDLPGGAACAAFYLVNGIIRAADPLGQPFLGKVKGFSTLFEPLSEGCRLWRFGHSSISPSELITGSERLDDES